MQDFLVEPPKTGASIDEWRDWLVRDDRARAVEKRRATMAEDHCDISDMPYFSGSMTTKVNGRYTQSTAIGFSGDFESGAGTLEVVVGAQQDLHHRQRGKRAGGKKRSNKRAARAKRFKSIGGGVR